MIIYYDRFSVRFGYFSFPFEPHTAIVVVVLQKRLQYRSRRRDDTRVWRPAEIRRMRCSRVRFCFRILRHRREFARRARNVIFDFNHNTVEMKMK